MDNDMIEPVEEAVGKDEQERGLNRSDTASWIARNSLILLPALFHRAERGPDQVFP